MPQRGDHIRKKKKNALHRAQILNLNPLGTATHLFSYHVSFCVQGVICCLPEANSINCWKYHKLLKMAGLGWRLGELSELRSLLWLQRGIF